MDADHPVLKEVAQILQLRPNLEGLKRDMAADVERTFLAKQKAEQAVKDLGLSNATLLTVSLAIDAGVKWVLAREKYESRFPEGAA